MANDLDPIELTVLGEPSLGDRVPLWAFAAVVGDWVAALRCETDSLSAKRTSVEWVLSDLKKGSAWASCDPVPLTPEGVLVAKEVQRRIIVATNHAMRGGDPGQAVHEKTSASILRLVRRVNDGDVPGFSLKSGALIADVRPTEIERDFPKVLARHAIGSVEGQLVAVSFAGRNSMFTVRDRLTGNLVRCYFDAQKFTERVRTGLLHRVAVSGRLTEQIDGDVPNISDVDAIYIFPSQIELPQPSDIMGIDPDLTEGMSAEEWIGLQRA
jgi:hypothetical protein